MSKGTVLITGINGYIAGTTALAFLKAGYSVRGTARSLSSATPLLSALSEYSDRLSVIQVPDITAPDAFDEAVKGVSFIAHLASPVAPAFTDAAEVMTAAVNGSLRVLESAAKEPGIKGIVLMSSLAAVRGSDGYRPDYSYTYTEKDWNTTSEAEVEKLGAEAGFPVYEASKTAAERAVWCVFFSLLFFSFFLLFSSFFLVFPIISSPTPSPPCFFPFSLLFSFSCLIKRAKCIMLTEVFLFFFEGVN